MTPKRPIEVCRAGGCSPREMCDSLSQDHALFTAIQIRVNISTKSANVQQVPNSAQPCVGSREVSLVKKVTLKLEAGGQGEVL
jgi:hypothetical protein